ncbi:CATRA conflict system CASPASE/TPR repeat-associated protein [Nonomuraea fuscirosea]|uniref:CATRA conflict system CASPASE/TPR repeat-associated protein n=1 Tax=Nonomuraea fuscirosea TaxID=1291556 RepID=UPI0033C4DA6E
MSNPILTDQELVVHLFAPVDGPFAAEAYEQIREIWARCRDRLGTTLPISGTGLLTHLPETLQPNAADGALAAQEDPRIEYQVIARRIHDVLNVSLVFALPLDNTLRAGRAAERMQNGWIEFDRWWDELSEGGTNALLGEVRIYQAKYREEQPIAAQADAVRTELPSARQRSGWMKQHYKHQSFVLWETWSGDDGRPERRLAVVAPHNRDAELSAWTWSRGDVQLPPLARYLMHAAKLRHQVRVWDGGDLTRQVEREAERRMDRIQYLLRDDPGPKLTADLRRLRADMANLTTISTNLGIMRRTVEIAVDNMTRSLHEPLPADLKLAEWFLKELDDASHYLNLTLSRAKGIQEIAQSHPPHQDDVPRSQKGIVPRGRTEQVTVRDRRAFGPELVRMGFAVDIVGFSTRSDPRKTDLQERLAMMLEHVLNDIDIGVTSTDRQDAGDGMKVFLPQELELHVTLPRLLHAWRDRLAQDNQRFSDRMRLRLAVVLGPVGVAALGYSGPTIIEVSRMLDSECLRSTMREQTEADLAVLVSDVLHRYVVAEGHPGLNPSDFRECRVETKGFVTNAWLWVAR